MIEIIAIGDEVLHGYTVNRNASFLSKFLQEAGFSPSYHHVVGDHKEDAKRLLEEAMLRGSFVIITGGLGPTIDDHTRAILADFFDSPLQFQQTLFEKLVKRFGDLPALRDQATVPRDAHLLENKIGSASGLVMRDEKRFPGACVVALPGVPAEMKALVQEYLLALLQETQEAKVKERIEILHFVRLWESTVDPLLRELVISHPAVHCGIYPGFGVLTLHLKSSDQKELQAVKRRIVTEWPQFLFESPSGELSEAVHLLLQKRGLKLATAESCTGGALAARLVAHSGASVYFQGSVIAYTNEVKKSLLGVKEETLEKYGAVSEEVTYEMASGVMREMSAGVAVSVSGILGPSGGSAEKPVGTVCATILFDGKAPHSWTMHLHGNREVMLDMVVNSVYAELLYRLQGT